jgi:hypothetical protein
LIAITFVLVAACGGKVDAPSDASPGVDSGMDSGDGAMCTYAETRTTVDRQCNAATDCVVVMRQLSCCQVQNEGIRADAASQFVAKQDAQTAGCPGCGCAAQPEDELGVKGVTFVATCDNGLCTAHAQ